MQTIAYQFRVGQEVVFGRPNGEQTRGEVKSVNAKSITIETSEERGIERVRAAGKKWRVHPSLVRPVDPNAQPVAITTDRPAPAPLTPAAELEIMREINSIYCQLSPENLYRDGEISRAQAMVKFRRLRGQMMDCFRRLGREVGEVEALHIVLRTSGQSGFSGKD